MEKLLIKDKKRRVNLKKTEIKHFIFKSIFKNLNFPILIRLNAFVKLAKLIKNNFQVAMSSRCLYSVNKKRFNKLTTFSRHIFLKLIRSGNISGIRKANW
jgi:ribosomal protein S14